MIPKSIDMARANGVSGSSSLARLRHRWCKVIFAWRFFGSWRHCQNGHFNKKYPPYSLMYNLQTVYNLGNPYLQLWTQQLPVYRCASRCVCVWLWRHGSSLRGSSVWLWSLFEICILLHQRIKYRNIRQTHWKQRSPTWFSQFSNCLSD